METVVAAFNYLGAIIVLRCNEIMIVGHRWSADISASNEGYPKVRNHGKGPTWAFSWLKAATTAFTFKTLLTGVDRMVSRCKIGSPTQKS